MLQDPENPYEEWSFEIFAKDLGTAQKQCQAIADTGELQRFLVGLALPTLPKIAVNKNFTLNKKLSMV